jgi:hypothetical protein
MQSVKSLLDLRYMIHSNVLLGMELYGFKLDFPAIVVAPVIACASRTVIRSTPEPELC